MNAYVETLGFIASVVSFVLWWPQAALVWRCRGGGEQLGAVSMSSQSLLLINAGLWGAYAIGTGSLWVGAPGLINGPLAILTIVLLRRARQLRPRTPGGGSPVPVVRPLHQDEAADADRALWEPRGNQISARSPSQLWGPTGPLEPIPAADTAGHARSQ